MERKFTEQKGIGARFTRCLGDADWTASVNQVLEQAHPEPNLDRCRLERLRDIRISLNGGNHKR
jgi:hypothetical protein